jgi:hypothetical protein
MEFVQSWALAPDQVRARMERAGLHLVATSEELHAHYLAQTRCAQCGEGFPADAKRTSARGPVVALRAPEGVREIRLQDVAVMHRSCRASQHQHRLPALEPDTSGSTGPVAKVEGVVEVPVEIADAGSLLAVRHGHEETAPSTEAREAPKRNVTAGATRPFTETEVDTVRRTLPFRRWGRGDSFGHEACGHS